MCAKQGNNAPNQAFSLADWYNDITHRPYIYELTHAIEWTVNLALAPLLIVGLWVKLFCELFTTAGWFPEDPHGRGAILVTGCDTGFGRKLVVDLAARGWKVYAGCLSPATIRELEGLGHTTLRPVLMDITRDKDVTEVMDRIREEEGGLYALVNNAGIAYASLIDWTPVERYRRMFEVNFFATLSTTKAALPLLKTYVAQHQHKTQARVVFVSSYVALFPVPMMYSAYGASKCALEGMSNAMRAEVRPFGIQVVTVNPTTTKTPILHTANTQLLQDFDNMGHRATSEYGTQYRDKMMKGMAAEVEAMQWEATPVHRVLLAAVTTSHPKPQYIVNADGRNKLAALNMLPLGVCNWLVTNGMPFQRNLGKPKAAIDGSYFLNQGKAL